MQIVLTPDDIRAGDDAAEYASKHWAWYLASGILTVIFGFVVLSFKVATAWTLAVFAGLFFVATGIAQIGGAFRAVSWKWTYVLGGVLSIAAGVISLVWPEVTLFVLAILVGWTLLFWGVADVITSLSYRHVPHWWLWLVRGILSIVLGVWSIAQPRLTLVVLVTVVGIWAVMFGVIEIFVSFEMKNARRAWEATKARLVP